MSCYDDLKERMDIDILRDLNAAIRISDEELNKNKMRNSILKSQWLIAQAAATFNSVGMVNHENLQPWQIAVLNSAACRLPSDDPNRINFKLEGRAKLKKALREDLMNERERRHAEATFGATERV